MANEKTQSNVYVMEKFLDTKNFLIKYLILELFEKLYRLSKYINNCKKFDRKNNTDKIVALFDNSIEIIGREIEDLCVNVNSELSPNDQFAYILAISQNSKAIKKIHEELKNLHSSWIVPEIKTFANEITKEKIRAQNEINVILSDNYSFLERNLGKQFELSLQAVYSQSNIAATIKDNHSFILPKIEFSNPLNWTIIVHEAGHLKSHIIEKLKERDDIMPDNIQSINQGKIKSWAEEIFCDIYALSVIGPAYLVSFITFALLNTMDYGISTSSDMHPSVMIRTVIMINYLKDNNLYFNRDWGVEDYSKELYSYLVSQSSIFNDKENNSVPGLTKFNTNLRSAIKELNLATFSISEKESKRIKKLVGNLKNGTPIGSVCDGSEIDAKEIIKKEKLSEEELKSIKTHVSERSCEIWEILNAGWIYKIEENCKKGAEIFFTENVEMDIVGKIKEYGKVINFLDDRLLSSINSAQIIKIIEANRYGIV